MNELVVVEKKRGVFDGLKRRCAGVVVAAAATFGVVVPAMAAPDGAAIATEIGATSAVVDSVGGGMITVFIGLMVFSVIIGMVLRKGK